MSNMHLSVVALYTKENEVINRLKIILVLAKLKLEQGLGIYKIWRPFATGNQSESGNNGIYYQNAEGS